MALVEWPEMAELDPSPALVIRLERAEDENARRVRIENRGVAGFDAAALSDWRVEDGE